MTLSSVLTISLYVLNVVFALVVIFISRKSASSTWAWLFVLFFLPIAGFILYLLLGRNLQKKHFIRWNTVHQEETVQYFKEQQQKLHTGTFEFPNVISKKYAQLIQMNLDYNHALLSSRNNVAIYTEGSDKFRALLEDIANATEHIHVQYYIFKMDSVGKSLYDALVKKAREGVEVKVIYDDLGSRKLKKKDFSALLAAGGEVEAFFSSYFTLLNPRINFRNHRKLVIIDGKIGYIGGFNVGDEYCCLDEKIGYWRDTHLRIVGHSVYSMQPHFLFDWHQAGAKDFYLIAASSGVDVRIMTPAKTDHPFVYGANSAYGGDLLKVGGQLFRYQKGFLHAKMMVVDDEIVTIGTANIDVRSFSLNFEINAIIYDETIAKQCREQFEADVQDSFEVTPERYENRSLWTKVREAVSRLLSPIL